MGDVLGVDKLLGELLLHLPDIVKSRGLADSWPLANGHGDLALDLNVKTVRMDRVGISTLAECQAARAATEAAREKEAMSATAATAAAAAADSGSSPKTAKTAPAGAEAASAAEPPSSGASAVSAASAPSSPPRSFVAP